MYRNWAIIKNGEKKNKQVSGICEFQSLSAWPRSSHLSLNVEACIPEPACQSDNTWLRIHTHRHTKPNSAMDGIWFLKEPQVLLNQIKGNTSFDIFGFGEAVTTKVHILLRHSVHSNKAWGPRENWELNPLNKFQRTEKRGLLSSWVLNSSHLCLDSPTA